MARAPTPTILVSLLIVVIGSAVDVAGAKNPGKFSDDLKGMIKKEKLSHFRFYWHDTLSGPNPTSVQVVNPASNTSKTGFGLMNMLDNPLTVGPDVRSKVVGKAQGFYASAAQKEVGLLMAMNFAFTAGKYNGSSVTLLGRNAVLDKVREMPVIGGTGLLRFARGYAKLTTYSADMKTKDAVVLYNVYVLHY